MIEGELVVLRAQERTDAERFHGWINDREVTRYLTTRYPMPLEAERAWFDAATASALAFFNVRYAIDTKDGRHIGNIGFNRVIPEQRSATLGITIGDKRYWSRGYGADAIRALLRFGFGQMNLHRVDLTVDADNARGIACYEKVGFRAEGRLRQARYRRGAYADWLVMGILRREFESAPQT